MVPVVIGSGDYGSDDYGSGDLVFQADDRHQNVCLGRFHKMDPS